MRGCRYAHLFPNVQFGQYLNFFFDLSITVTVFSYKFVIKDRAIESRKSPRRVHESHGIAAYHIRLCLSSILMKYEQLLVQQYMPMNFENLLYMHLEWWKNEARIKYCWTEECRLGIFAIFVIQFFREDPKLWMNKMEMIGIVAEESIVKRGGFQSAPVRWKARFIYK